MVRCPLSRPPNSATGEKEACDGNPELSPQAGKSASLATNQLASSGVGVLRNLEVRVIGCFPIRMPVRNITTAADGFGCWGGGFFLVGRSLPILRASLTPSALRSPSRMWVASQIRFAPAPGTGRRLDREEDR